MAMLKKIGRLFQIKTRFEAWLVIYAIALGAVERGRLYLETYPGWGGWMLALACTGVVFIAGGKLLVSSMDLSGDLGDRLVARQLRASLLAYAASDQLQPAHAVTPEIVRSIVERRDGHDAGRAAS